MQWKAGPWTQDAGFGLIEILIVVGIAATVTMANIAVIQSLNKENRRIKAKLELLDIRNELQRILSNPTTCLDNLSAITVNDTSVDDANYSVPMSQILHAAGAAPLLRVGENIDRVSVPAMVTSILARNWMRLGPDTYKFDLEFAVQLPESAPLAPMQVLGVTVRTTSAPAAAKTPVSCGTSAGTLASCRFVSSPAPNNSTHEVYCNPGERVVSGGARCLMPDGSPWNSSTTFATFGYVTVSVPVQTGGVDGWAADCFNGNPTDGVRVETHAVCCPN